MYLNDHYILPRISAVLEDEPSLRRIFRAQKADDHICSYSHVASMYVKRCKFDNTLACIPEFTCTGSVATTVKCAKLF